MTTRRGADRHLPTKEATIKKVVLAITLRTCLLASPALAGGR
jgi:hypothetical protein